MKYRSGSQGNQLRPFDLNGKLLWDLKGPVRVDAPEFSPV